MELWKLFGFSNYLQNKQIKDHLAADSNKPKCPHCGGPTEPSYTRCKNCGQKIAWAGHVACKPGNLSKVQNKARSREREDRIKQLRLDARLKPYIKWFNRIFYPIVFIFLCWFVKYVFEVS